MSDWTFLGSWLGTGVVLYATTLLLFPIHPSARKYAGVSALSCLVIIPLWPIVAAAFAIFMIASPLLRLIDFIQEILRERSADES
jgi:ethanolamine transporter EutH